LVQVLRLAQLFGEGGTVRGHRGIVRTQPSVLMAVGPVHVAVRELLLRGNAHVHDPATEAQRLTGQG
jgi:hypothetical protein